MEICDHLDSITDPIPETQGCEDCLAAGKHAWVHLRTCQTCGHVGCCDQSPERHASAHFNATGHPIVRSYEPGESWYWCYVDQVGFELSDHPEAPSYS
ncbi:MAG TPA: UBP-type zinc finger domain-containing protein [Acidimicrobiia bacterium]|nr:UBP-type zinc finger domain-containing protein [Acidimicrobiia bacterium]